MLQKRTPILIFYFSFFVFGLDAGALTLSAMVLQFCPSMENFRHYILATVYLSRSCSPIKKYSKIQNPYDNVLAPY